MNWIKGSGPYFVLLILLLCVMILSIFDIIYDKGWMNIIFGIYAFLFIITIIVLYMKSKETVTIPTIEEFEKTLKGGLYHFKCPICSGIFAIKKSKSNNKKQVKMTCPGCGAVGIIPSYPAEIEEEIPEKKSINANFKCNICGEGITIWAEGSDLFKNTNVYSCPFCGQKEPLKRI